MLKLYTEDRIFTDKDTKEDVVYEQVMLEVGGEKIPIKATFKSDARLLRSLAREGKE